MTRIPPLDPPYDDEIGPILESMMPPGVDPLILFRTLARNPRILSRVLDGSLLDRGAIERVDRELAILRTCAVCRSEYEWGVHVSAFARRFGIPDEKIRGTLEWPAEDTRWTAHEARIVALVDALHAEARIPDALWRGLREEFEEDQLIELIVLVGFYHTISFVTNGLELGPEPAAERFPSASAP